MISLRFLENIQVAVQVGSGEVDLNQLISAAMQWRKDENYTPFIPVVWDLVAADVILDWAEIKEALPEHLKRVANSRDASARTAWVVGEDVSQIVLESIHLAYPWTTEWQVFKDAEEAVAWAIADRRPAC